MISGMDAARALSGSRLPIPGASTAGSGPAARSCPPTWSSAAAPPRPRPSPARAAASPDCSSRATASASTTLVERMFNEPAGSAIEYRALGAQVLLLVGSFDRVTSLTPPFDRWGAVRETQASFWIPVLAGRDLGELFLAERVLLAVPYIFVDNPMSYLGGREATATPRRWAASAPRSGLAMRCRCRPTGQLRPRRGRGLARLPRARGARAARRAERGPARRPARAAAPPRG